MDAIAFAIHYVHNCHWNDASKTI